MKLFWKKMTLKGKIICTLIIFILLFSPLLLSAGKTLTYVITHGNEIDSFKPHTLKQCREDFKKFQ